MENKKTSRPVALAIKGLSKTYFSKKGDVEALKAMEFSIEKGEVFGLLGPNGAGKSTLINILAGVTDLTTGTAIVDGIDISKDHTLAKRKIGIVPQEIGFDVFFTVGDAMKLQYGYYGLPFDAEHSEAILKKLSLFDKKDDKPRQLSGGMQRRFMIAKALVHKPSVLILDEPTAGVDVELRHDLYDLVRELNADGITIVLTSHYLEEVELLCDRVAIIQKGELIALDHKEELKKRFSSDRELHVKLAKSEKIVPKSLGGFAPKLEGRELQLTFAEDDYNEVLTALVKSKLEITSFKVTEPSLEDVFVSLTHEK